MEFTLVTGRTIDQGCTKEHAKLSDEYKEYVALCEMHPEDMRRLNVKEGDNVKITTSVGSIVVKAKMSRRIRDQGIIFIPFGPWINMILPSETDGTGMPPMKGFKARVEPTEDQVLGLKDLLLKIHGGKKALLWEG
ncbi:MAG: tRNA CCA-pyrophosphorylase [Candidatus Bathyarchaeota archaeon]|nr:tRNA CCA-pyrophosphorylase [Candidatus Bathyarchaeota archaeon]